MAAQKRKYKQIWSDSELQLIDKTQKMAPAKLHRRRLPAELCVELIKCIPPFALQYGTSIGRCLARMCAYGPVSAQFDAFLHERRDKIEKKKLMQIWLQVFGFIPRLIACKNAPLAARSFAVIGHIRLHEQCTLFTQNNTRKMRSFEITNGNAPSLPKCPPPENIIEYGVITICHYDVNVLAFFKFLTWGSRIGIGRLSNFQANIVAMKHMLRLPTLCFDAIEFVGIWIVDFAKIFANFPQLLAKCQMLDVDPFTMEGMSQIPKLFEWLADARKDGQPKQLCFCCCTEGESTHCEMLTGLIKGDFLTTNVPSSFLVRMSYHGRNVKEFTAQNANTGEQLSLEFRKNSSGICYVLITRCAGDSNSKQLAEIEERKQALLNWNCVEGNGIVNFCVREIE